MARDNDSIDALRYQMELARNLSYKEQLARMASGGLNNMANAFGTQAAQQANMPSLDYAAMPDIERHRRKLDATLHEQEKLETNLNHAIQHGGYDSHEASALATCMIMPFYAEPAQGALVGPLKPARREAGSVGRCVMLPGCGLFTTARGFDPNDLGSPEVWPTYYNVVRPLPDFRPMSFNAQCALAVALALQFARQDVAEAEAELARTVDQDKLLRATAQLPAQRMREYIDTQILQQMAMKAAPSPGIISRILGSWKPDDMDKFDELIKVHPMPPLPPKLDL